MNHKTLVKASRIKALKAASQMPQLSHYRDRSKPWSPEQSEVLNWIMSDTDCASFVMAIFANSGAIGYDKDSKTWAGTPENIIASAKRNSSGAE